MPEDASEIIKKLAKIQAELRQELFEELRSKSEELESIFDPYSYSPIVQELREKYLVQLFVLQGLIQQLACLNPGHRKLNTRVISVSAGDQAGLVNLVNRKLASLNGARVLDVSFMPENEENGWTALITYVPGPLAEEADGTTAWM